MIKLKFAPHPTAMGPPGGGGKNLVGIFFCCFCFLSNLYQAVSFHNRTILDTDLKKKKRSKEISMILPDVLMAMMNDCLADIHLS